MNDRTPQANSARTHEPELVPMSRSNMRDHVELRVLVPRQVIGAIDAEVIARGGEGANVYRATVVQEILAPWAEKKVHDAMVMVRLAAANPTGSEGGAQ